ncbi:formate dehydrogenase accessory protein FdhE [Clostridium formicaceticum]|nr:formate dehydrogenase accessory protein FdhE [Clostridium formicaceticum]ARE88355.1 formate dehydrogenase accessory protein FdhE [Clostridium formicaceticum]
MTVKFQAPDNLVAFYREIAKSQAWAQLSINKKFETKLLSQDKNKKHFERKSVLLDKIIIDTDEKVFGEVFKEILHSASKFTDNSDNLKDLLAWSKEVDMGAYLHAALQGDYQEIISKNGISSPESISYFGELAVRPYLRVMSNKAGGHHHHEWKESFCPICGRKAAFSVLENDCRTLVCIGCYTEWVYPYLKCSTCETLDHSNLGFLIPEGIEGEKVFICKECCSYIKMFDREVLQESDLQLADLNTLYLDLLAISKDYYREDSINPLIN